MPLKRFFQSTMDRQRSKKALDPQSNLMELLEPRQLLSANIRIDSFGGRPNDGVDDRPALLATVKAAKSGDRIRFSAGTYDFSTKTEVPSGLSLIGYGDNLGGQTTLRSADNDFSIYFREDGLKIDHMTFDGGGLFMDRHEAAVTNVAVTNCVFTNIQRGGDIGAGRGSIGDPAGRVNGFSLKNNLFSGSSDGSGLYIYTGDGWRIQDNTFSNLTFGIKSNNAGDTAHDIWIQRNYFTLNDYHSVELQGCVDGFWFTDNYYDNARLSSNPDDNKSIFAFSLIYTNPSRDQHVLRNYINAQELTDGIGVRLGFELGENTELKDNYIACTSQPFTFYGGGSYADNNWVMDTPTAAITYGPGSETSVITSNNGTFVKVATWNISRAKPGAALLQGLIEKEAALSTSAPPAVAARRFAYASDLTWAEALNTVGPVEKDKGVGGKAAGDGAKMTIGDQAYAKGLGVGGASTIVYNTKKKYSSFISAIGIDELSGSKGSMIFQIWGDGVLLFDSGIVRGSAAAENVRLNIRGVNQIKLVTTDAGDGKGRDLGNWGAARFYL